MKQLKLMLAFIALIIAISNSMAQEFSYTLSANTVNYSDLQSPTALSEGTDWNTTNFKLAIGFSFPFLGQNFDSLRIEPNGFLVFGNNRNYAIAMYKGLFCKRDSNDAWSSVSYTTSGSVVKIQFKHLGFDPSNPKELFSYQVWLYSSGNVEIHTGPNPTADYIANGQSTLLGLINMNQDTPVKAYVASGDPAAPTGSALNTQDELLYLNPVPADGRVFTFSHQ